jgi:endonuclease/exonuclease/phosphatase family metal-dependent hydrolase
MRIVTLNAWGGQLWDALAAWLPGCGADVLLLQEVTRAPDPAPPWLEYRDAYRHLWQRADLFGDVRHLLPAWQAVFAPAARGPLSSDDAGILRSEHGIAAFFAPHLAVTAMQSVFIHGAFRAEGWGPEPVPRPKQLFRVFDPDLGASLVVAHLHGLRDASGKGDTPARQAQAERIAAALAAFAAPGEPVVLGGDFNLLPGSATFARLAELGLRDLVTAHGIEDTRTSHYAKPVRHADYMLVTDGVRVAGFDAPAAPEVSDHRPLVLDVAAAGGR